MYLVALYYEEVPELDLNLEDYLIVGSLSGTYCSAIIFSYKLIDPIPYFVITS